MNMDALERKHPVKSGYFPDCFTLPLDLENYVEAAYTNMSKVNKV